MTPPTSLAEPDEPTVRALAESVADAAHKVAWETSHALAAGTIDSPVTLARLREAVSHWEHLSALLNRKVMASLANIPPPGIRCRRCGLVDDTCDSCDTQAEARAYGDLDDADPYGWAGGRR